MARPSPSTATHKRRQLTKSKPISKAQKFIDKRPFRFFDLSAELRNIIYAMALSEGTPIPILAAWRVHHKQPQPQLRALIQTSRAFRQEGLGLFYALNTFKIGDEWGAQGYVVLVAWLKSLSTPAIANIRRFNVVILRHRQQSHGKAISIDLSIEDRSCAVRYVSNYTSTPHTRLLSEWQAAMPVMMKAMFRENEKLCVTLDRIVGFLEVFSLAPDALSHLVTLESESIREELIRIS